MSDSGVNGACGCGGGPLGPSTPAMVDNPPGQPSLRRRVGTHARFKEAMLARLTAPSEAIRSALGLAADNHGSSAAWPLRALRTRADDDPAIALLDAWAMASDVLAFHTERIAHESYLRTATERWSAQELAALVGYRARPGVAATTTLAFTVESAPGSPAHVPIPTGSKVQTIPEPGQTAQMFETIEALEAQPAFNATPVRWTTPWVAEGAVSVELDGLGLNVRIGDLLLITADAWAYGMAPPWSLRRIVDVTEHQALRRTRVQWRVEIDPAISSPRAYVLRQRANVFGHNAPAWSLLPKDVRDKVLADDADGPRLAVLRTLVAPNTLGTATSNPTFPTFTATILSIVVTEWPGLDVFVDGPAHVDFAPEGFSRGSLELAGAYPGIVEGSWVVLRSGAAQRLFQIEAVAEGSRSGFGLSGPVTRLTISGHGLDQFDNAVRTLVVLCQSEPVPIAAPLRTDRLTGADIDLATVVDAPWSGRRIVVEEFDEARQRTIAAEGAIVHSATVVDGRTRLSLVKALTGTFDPTRTRVLGNVAVATHGETVHEFLGSGDAASIHQRFTIRQSPLTHIAAANESGAASTLRVRVGDVEWTEVESLVGRDAAERVFATRPGVDPEQEGRTTVQFGDGLDGPRLPTGANNVRASYRRGIGHAGNAAAGQVSQLMSRPLGLKAARNPVPAEGGADAEPRDQLRANAPLSVLTLGRVVSLRDHEDFARGFAGVGKALAQWAELTGTAISGHTGLAARRGVLVTVAGDDNAELGQGSATIHLLRTALVDAGCPFTPVAVVPHRAVGFSIVGRVLVDSRHDTAVVAAAIDSALRRDFGFAARRFAQSVAASEVVASLHAIAGVIAVDVDRLRRIGSAAGGTATQAVGDADPLHLRARRAAIGPTGMAQGAELLTYEPMPDDLVPVPMAAATPSARHTSTPSTSSSHGGGRP